MFLGRDMRGTTVTKDVDRNFSGRALRAAGVGSDAIFQFPVGEGGLYLDWSLQWSK